MAEPTLGEIESIHGDPNIGLATTGVAPNIIAPNTNELAYLDAAAQRKDAANQFILQQHQANLTNTLKNFNDIDVSGVYGPDYNKITQDYKNLTGEIYDNYDVIQNPNKNPELYAELMQKESALRSAIAQSKQDYAVDKNTQAAIDAHPTLTTQQNIDTLANFRKGTLGSRALPNLQPPPVINHLALNNAVDQQAALSAYDEQATSVIDSTGHVISKKQKIFDPNKYTAAYKAGFYNTDAFGRPLIDTLKMDLDDYNKANPSAPLTVDQYLDKQAAANIKNHQNQIEATSIQGDPLAEEKLREIYGFKMAAVNHKYTLEEQAAQQENALRIAKLKGEIKTETDFNKTGTSINTLTASLFDPSNEAPQTIGYTNGITGQTEHLPVVIAPEDQKALFAYTTYNTLGKKVTIVPDVLAKTPDGHIRAIFYQEDTKGKANTGGAPKIDKAHTQDFTPDNIRNILFNEVPSNGRAKAQNAAIRQSPTLNDPTILKSYLSGGTGPADTEGGKIKTTISGSALPKQVSDKASYDAINVGDQYIAPDGKVYIKK